MITASNFANSMECQQKRNAYKVWSFEESYSMKTKRTVKNHWFLCPVKIIVLFAMVAMIPSTTSAQELSSKEKRTIKTFSQHIDRAASAYVAKRYSSSADSIEKAIEKYEELLVNDREELKTAIAEDVARLKKAHELLVAAGEKLPAIGGMPAAGAAAGGDAISFKESVAPILIAKCGNCHVNQSRGDFSAASYTALVNSTTIAFGKADDSRLIEVIVNGEMPKGGLKVSDDELKTLKAWIAQGAKFDGTDRGQNLRELTGAAAAPPRRGRVEVMKPTGKETVSFGLDIAPVLVDQCADCHLTRNPRGNFSMANFQTFLRGGDGGTPIDPGKTETSALIKRLHGDGVQRMPPDRRLDDEVVKKFETWIREGAKFDGGDPQLDFMTVAATVKASVMSHEDLIADRKRSTESTWKLAMGDIESKMVPTENFLVAASAKEDRLEDVSAVCEEVVANVAKTLKLEKGDPFVKGNISVFIFSKRYDFSEFGRMVEKREFAKELDSHWNYDVINAYAALIVTRNQSAKDVSVDLTRQITALHFASQAPDVPRWFADGMGYWAAKRIYPRDESLVELDQEAAAAVAAMTRLDDFVQNRLPGDQTALASYLFVKQLKAGSASAFDRLLKGIKSGQSFEQSFGEAYGMTPAAMLQKLSKG